MEIASSFTELAADEQKRLLDKLAKLKALSECPTGNVNETATAAATMTRIMLEYQIEMADLEVSEPEGVVDEPVTGEEIGRGYPTWQTQLLTVLADVNHCVGYTSVAAEYRMWTRTKRCRLGLMGTPQDIENTRKIFLFCVNEIERLCQAWGVRQPIKRKNDFRTGASCGIIDKVIQARDKVMEELRAQALPSRGLELFGRKDRAVQAFAENMGVYQASSRSRGVARDAYHAGYEAGANLDLDAREGPRKALPASQQELLF